MYVYIYIMRTNELKKSPPTPVNDLVPRETDCDQCKFPRSILMRQMWGCEAGRIVQVAL